MAIDSTKSDLNAQGQIRVIRCEPRPKHCSEQASKGFPIVHGPIRSCACGLQAILWEIFEFPLDSVAFHADFASALKRSPLREASEGLPALFQSFLRPFLSFVPASLPILGASVSFPLSKSQFWSCSTAFKTLFAQLFAFRLNFSTFWGRLSLFQGPQTDWVAVKRFLSRISCKLSGIFSAFKAVSALPTRPHRISVVF